jgi:succinate dehydrogenase/fumarate reductase flavoprotein subunit
MSAALAASIEGLEVLLCEKSDQVGGTSATSAGTLWIPGNTQGRAAGFGDTIEAAQRYLDALLPGAQARPLRTTYLAAGAAAIDYFAAKSEVKFLSAGAHPDYRALPGAAVSGRALVPAPFDGRLLGEDFARVRPPLPEFLVLGGMMVGKPDIPVLTGALRSRGNFLGAARLVARYLADRLRYSRGTRLVMGNALVGRLFYSLKQRGVPVRFEAPLVELVRDGERVTGAVVAHGGERLCIAARKGVVLATGGLGRNAELRRRFMRAAVRDRSLTCATNAGDGVSAALRVDASVAPGRGSGGLWTPASATWHRGGGLFPHLILDRAKPGMIAVNAAGERFVNEACSYHDFAEAMLASQAVPAYLVCDADFARRYGLGVAYPGTRDVRKYEARGYLVCGDTLDELAGKAGIDGAGLRRSIARHNALARSGVDEDFHKGEAVLDRFNGDASRKPNPCLGPIERPPFCALKVWPADIGTSDGLATNENAEALDASGRPIAGLYACGNDMASIFLGTYPGPGITLGPALVFGYLAARHAAS